MTNRYAFTLIELLVVVLIIGILAAVAVPQYNVAVIKSRYATLKNLATRIQQAEELYYLANGSYIMNFNKLDIMPPGGQLNTSTGNNYQYDWGYCVILATETQASCGCTNTNIEMSYQIFFDHSAFAPKRRLCIARGTQDQSALQSRVCRQETKQNTGTSSQGNLVYYYK